VAGVVSELKALFSDLIRFETDLWNVVDARLRGRRSNPVDRRSSVIELTASGRRLLARADTVFEDELQRRLASTVSPAALTRLGVTLRTLRSAIDRPPDQEVGSA